MPTNEGARRADGPGGFRGRHPQQTRQTQHALAQHWEVLPPQAREFLLAAPGGALGLEELVDFWSASAFRTFVDNPKRMMWSSLYLALNYLRRDMIAQARSFMINGVFFHQLCETPFRRVKELRESNAPAVVLEEELYFIFGGIRAARCPARMRPWIECYLPDQFVQVLTPHANSSEQVQLLGSYADQVSDSQEGPKKGGKRHSRQGEDEGTPIQLIFVDGANEDERYSFEIGSRSTLKALFNEYAEKRGVSLRSLRFSHAGKALFLSTAGNKTPEQLGMQNQSIINVHGAHLPEENPPVKEAPSSTGRRKKNGTKKNRNQRKGRKGRKIQAMKPTTVEKTTEELKIEHSKMLDVLHAELQPRLKQIRQRLNNLAIERSQSKIRPTCRNLKKAATGVSQAVTHNPCQTLGGKAGKSHFLVHVGEVANLYKPMRPPASGPHGHCGAPPLDLHGLGKEDALARLDESLGGWVDAAMRGSYPFVMQAEIVCGGGNQILRETVEEWIRSKRNVCKAPKR